MWTMNPAILAPKVITALFLVYSIPSVVKPEIAMSAVRLVVPATVIKVEQEGTTVSFHFSFAQDFGSDKKKSPNDKVGEFVVLDAIGQEIWKIEARSAYYSSSMITYGEVPENFTQVVPKSGSPSKLIVGENYYVRVLWPAGSTSFVYR